MQREEATGQLEQKGYLVLRGFLEAAEIQSAAAQISTIVRNPCDQTCRRPHNHLFPLRWNDPLIEILLSSEARMIRLARETGRTICAGSPHMGSRAVVLVCKDEPAAVKRFGVQGEGRGSVYTRTGRRFFNDDPLQHAVLERLAAALDCASFWDRFQTDWFCLDCELMPWSVKAEDLLRTRYAPAGAAARTAVEAARASLRQASIRGLAFRSLSIPSQTGPSS